MIRASVLLLLGLTAGTPEDLVRQMGDEEIEVRERATAELARMSVAARPALVRALRHSDPEIAGRARQLLDRLALEVRLPLEEDGAVPASRVGEIQAAMVNVWADDWVYLKAGLTMVIELLELGPQEELNVPERRGGAFGRSISCGGVRGCRLSTADFVTLRAGEERPHGYTTLFKGAVRLPEELARKGMILNNPDRAGRYRITVRYACDPGAYLARCTPDCVSHGDPAQPWHRAAAMRLEKSVEFRVRNDRDPR